MADENNTIETLPDEDELNLTDEAENELLGQEGAFASPVAPITQPPGQTPAVAPVAPSAPQAVPVQPPVQTPEQDAAFAAQRRWYEQQLTLANVERERLQNLANQVLQHNAPPAAKVPTFEESNPMPDPVDNPKEFAAWAVARARHELSGELQATSTRVESIEQVQRVNSYAQSLRDAEAKYGQAWSTIYAAAGQFATEFPSSRNDVFNDPNPGEALARLGLRALGGTFTQPTGTQQQPVQQPAQPKAMTEAEIRADERAKAVRELAAKAAKSGYNLAPPSMTNTRPAVAASSGAIKPGSAEEDALLGS